MCLPPVRPVYGLGRAQNAPDRESAGQGHVESGGGGNRTRVLRRLIKASPGAACCSFLSPSVLAGKTLRAQSLFGFPTAPVTGAIGGALYRCQVPERGHIWADSSATVRQRERAGCYRHLLKSPRVVNEITRHPRPASLESTSEVETVHPLVGFGACLPFHSTTRSTPGGSLRFRLAVTGGRPDNHARRAAGQLQ